MAASIATVATAPPAMSQKQRRAISKKGRRKRKRQALAQAKASDVKDGEIHTPEEEGEEDDDDDDVAERTEEERQRLHEKWLARENLAQEEFKLRFEREMAARKRKEEEERMIKEEWEAQQRREQEEKEQKNQKKRDRERETLFTSSTCGSQDKDEAVQKMLDRAESELENGGPWMNPEAPVTGSTQNYGTERDIANCPFFLKTGACRFGDRCSRKHVHPTASPTLMIRGMFVTFGMEQCRRDDYDTDACLEHSEEELQEYFIEFYHDVLPEFRSVGKVVQFKVSCNFEPHLKGNVYVQFDTEEQCRDASVKFNGRWYAGKQLHCEICPVTRWKNAICGLFDRQRCPKGKHCNFLHVFRNPGNEFWEADRDLHMSPDRCGEGSYRGGRYSERYGDRSWRQRNGSRSPPRSERSYSRRGVERRRRSCSRERGRESSRTSQHQRGASMRSNVSSWSRMGSSSRRDGHRSRSREKDRLRDRSRSREKDRLRDRSRSREKDRLRDRSRSREKDRLRDRSRSREKDRLRDRSRSREKDRLRDRSRSREKDRLRDRSRSREKDRLRDRSRSREKDRLRDRSRSRDNNRERDGSRSRDNRERDGSRSRDNRERDGSRSREKDRLRGRSRSREKDGERDGSKSKDRDRSRSRDKDGERDGSRSRDGEQDGSKRSRDEDKERDGSKSRSREKDRSRSRSGDGEREKQTGERRSNLSPENPGRKASDDAPTARRHKHSKKSKKKSKKKHRKKRGPSPEDMTSSAESEKEEELVVEEGEGNHSAENPSKEVNDVELVQNTGELGLKPITQTKTDTESTTGVQESHSVIPTEPSGNGEINHS